MISFPRTDIIGSLGYTDQTFKLLQRQEQSRSAYGRTFTKDLGSGLWTAAYTTQPLLAGPALTLEAALNSLDGAIQTFEAYDLRRDGPYAHPRGVGANDGVVDAVDTTSNRRIRLSGLNSGQVLAAGDYVAWDFAGARALHQIVDGGTANASGISPMVELRPALRGLAVGTAVALKAPRGIFVMVPGSFDSRAAGGLHSTISFQAVQAV